MNALLDDLCEAGDVVVEDDVLEGYRHDQATNGGNVATNAGGMLAVQLRGTVSGEHGIGLLNPGEGMPW